MDLSEDSIDAHYIINGYRPGSVIINHTEHKNNLVISPDKLINPWNVSCVSGLGENEINTLIDLQPEIILFGTGRTLKLLNPKIIATLSRKGIAFETMNTDAACRTYGVLVSEGRKAVAALIV